MPRQKTYPIPPACMGLSDTISEVLKDRGSQLEPGVRRWDVGWCRVSADWRGTDADSSTLELMEEHGIVFHVNGNGTALPPVLCRVDFPTNGQGRAQPFTILTRKRRVVDACAGFAERNAGIIYVPGIDADLGDGSF